MPYCVGCRPRYKQSAFLKKHYQLLLKGEVEYCNECLDYPCKNLRHIDKRYCTLYRMSILDNLEIIRQHGVAKLIEREERKWRCPECGDVICCHNGICFNCGIERIKAKEKPYRWEDD